MSESPENKNLPVATDQPQPPAMTPATAAPLIGFAEAVRPLLTEYMRSTHENTHQKQEH